MEPIVAKDKTKKADDETKVKKSKGSDAFARPSDAPAGGDSWNLTEEGEGELLLMTPLRMEDVETKKYGSKKVVVADIVVVNTKKPDKSEAHEEVFVFGGYLVGALKGYIGERKVLGRLVKADDKDAGRGFHWEFEDADEDDIAAATEYINSVDVFKSKKK